MSCLFVFFAFFNIQKTEIKSNPQPKTELAKVIGESIQAKPQDWCYLKYSTYKDCDYCTAFNYKCLYEINFTLLSNILKDTTFSETTFGKIKLINRNKSPYQFDFYNMFELNDSMIVESSTTELTLSPEDTKYLNYQLKNYLFPYIKNEIRKKEIKDSLEYVHRNDSLQTIYIKKLKGCL